MVNHYIARPSYNVLMKYFLFSEIEKTDESRTIRETEKQLLPLSLPPCLQWIQKPSLGSIKLFLTPVKVCGKPSDCSSPLWLCGYNLLITGSLGDVFHSNYLSFFCLIVSVCACVRFIKEDLSKRACVRRRC